MKIKPFVIKGNAKRIYETYGDFINPRFEFCEDVKIAFELDGEKMSGGRL